MEIINDRQFLQMLDNNRDADLQAKQNFIDCYTCNPLINGWCEWVTNTKGKMLDEKCPRVALFIKGVMKNKIDTPAEQNRTQKYFRK